MEKEGEALSAAEAAGGKSSGNVEYMFVDDMGMHVGPPM